MSKVISGRGKIEFSGEKDKETMEKKYPDVQFEKMNSLTFTTTYKGNEMFDLKIKVGSTEIPCSFKKWVEPWKYGSKLALRPHFKDLGKKAVFNVSGGIQGELFQFFRYEIDKMLKDNPQRQESIKLKAKKEKLTNKQKKAINAHLIQKYSYKKWAESLSDKADPELLKEYNKILKNPDKELEKIKKDNKQKGGGICWPCLLTIPSKRKKGGGKKTFKKEQKKENKEYSQSVKKCRKMKDKKTKRRCYLKCNDKRSKKLKAFGKKYPVEWKEFTENYGRK